MWAFLLLLLDKYSTHASGHNSWVPNQQSNYHARDDQYEWYKILLKSELFARLDWFYVTMINPTMFIALNSIKFTLVSINGISGVLTVLIK